MHLKALTGFLKCQVVLLFKRKYLLTTIQAIGHLNSFIVSLNIKWAFYRISLCLCYIKKALITIDAMGCQRAIAEKRVGKQGDDVLALKDNQGQLYEAVVDYFQTAQATDFIPVEVDQKQIIESGHGRIETRTHYWVTDLSTLATVCHWAGLRSIGWVEAKRAEKASGKTSIEHRYSINSITDSDL